MASMEYSLTTINLIKELITNYHADVGGSYYQVSVPSTLFPSLKSKIR